MEKVKKIEELRLKLKELKDDFSIALDEVVEENVIEPFTKNKSHIMNKTK